MGSVGGTDDGEFDTKDDSICSCCCCLEAIDCTLKDDNGSDDEDDKERDIVEATLVWFCEFSVSVAIIVSLGSFLEALLLECVEEMISDGIGGTSRFAFVREAIFSL